MAAPDAGDTDETISPGVGAGSEGFGLIVEDALGNAVEKEMVARASQQDDCTGVRT